MDGKWRRIGALGLLLGIVVGCRTVPPNVKPDDGPEVLNKPPMEARYNAPTLPKEAFNREDPSKRYRELSDNPIMPTRGGNFGGPAGGGMIR
jgi:hypothetical protein